MGLLETFREQIENETAAITTERGLTKRGDSLFWWYCKRILDLEDAEADQIYCDGYNDYGIDAIRIDDSDDTVHFYSFKHPESIDKALKGEAVDKLLQGLSLLINNKLTGANANESLLKRASEIKLSVPRGYQIHFVTSGKGQGGDVAVKLDNFIEQLQAPSEDFCRWYVEDIKTLQSMFYTRTAPSVKQAFVFALDMTPYQVRAGQHECHMFVCPAGLLAGLYETHREALLQQNIRVTQGDKATNGRIYATATTEAESINFLHYNNGIVFLAEEARYDPFSKKLTVSGFQVVNGGQTIRMLARAHDAAKLRGDVQVAVRVITSAHDKEFACNVTVNLNNQNPMEPSFLRSNDPQVVQLAYAMASRGWYLERRENELKTMSPADRAALEKQFGAPVEAKTVRLRTGMQAYVSTYMEDPELAKAYTKKMFVDASDGGQFEAVFSKDLSAEKVIEANRLLAAVGAYVELFLKHKRKRDPAKYEAMLGTSLYAKHKDLVDIVIPPSTVFLCAVVYAKHVRIGRQKLEDLLRALEAGDHSPLNACIETIIDARLGIAGESRSWPTLLKSKILFQTVLKQLEAGAAKEAKGV
ncbi:MAG: AIPR family protein [Planctomycetes bacterium]|nr:AIPR family protein [Planctomycetota bacterium]